MSYDWEFPNLHLHGFCDYGFKFIGEMREMPVPCKHMYYVSQHVIFVANLKVSFISRLEIAMKFVTCWFILLLLCR
jgi:hypothetical protein